MAARRYTTEEGKKSDNLAIATPKMGFTRYAERLNGRLAMIGFVVALCLELFTEQGAIGWLTNLF